MKGILKAVSDKNRSVLIEVTTAAGPQEAWLKLADNVKTSYCKKGPCEFTEEDEVITFIKCFASSTPEVSVPEFKPATKTYQANKQYDPTDEINQRMAALKYASNIFTGTGKEDEFKKLTMECIKYLKTGLWDNE